MSEWREVTLGDAVELKRGYDLPTAQRRPGEVPIVSSSGRSGFHDVAKVAGPGVVTGRYGTLGEVFYIEEDFWPLNTALYVRDFKGNHPRFVAALLSSLDLGRREGAAAVPGVNRNHLHVLPVAIPDPPTQAVIAEVLTAIDDLIENNRRRIALLEQMARAIYREWFEAEPGQIESRRISEVATIVRGRSYRKQEIVEDGGVPFINLKCMQRGGGFRRDGLKRYDGPFKPAQKTRSGDIVMAVTDLTQSREILARSTLVPRLAEEFGVISLDVVRVVPKAEDDRLPLFLVLRHSDLSERVKEFANGSTVLHLSPDHIADAFISWPSQDQRAKIAELASDVFGLIDDLADAIDRLVKLRDLLLPKLVTGTIDVSHLDLDALLDEAAA